MANQTDKFDPPGSGGGVVPSNPIQNFDNGSFNFIDGDGRVLANVPLDANGQARFKSIYTLADVGQKTIKARFTGNHTYKAGAVDKFTMHVKDKNGKNATSSGQKVVTQIVAGPGIYISAPNGQGIVTISTSPIATEPTTSDLFAITWTDTDEENLPFGVTPQFVAGGRDGVNLRSRDGVNWVQMKSADSADINGISCIARSTVPDGNIEMNGVGPEGRSIYGRNGVNSDAMTQVIQLSDQNGLITEDLYNTYAFACYGENTGGGGGETTSTAGAFILTLKNVSNQVVNNGTVSYYKYGDGTYNNGSEEVAISISPPAGSFWVKDTANSVFQTTVNSASMCRADIYIDDIYYYTYFFQGRDQGDSKYMIDVERSGTFEYGKMQIDNIPFNVTKDQIYTVKVKLRLYIPDGDDVYAQDQTATIKWS